MLRPGRFALTARAVVSTVPVMKTLALCMILLLLAWGAAPAARATGGSPQEDVPLDSWIYDAVFALSSRGHFPNLLLHTRPYTRGVIADGIAAMSRGARELDSGEYTLFRRLEAEFQEELAEQPEAAATTAPARLAGGATAHIDQFEKGFSKNRYGFDLPAAVTAPSVLAMRIRVRFDSDGRHDTQFRGEYWKENFTAWVDQAVVTVRIPRFTAAFGREFWRWGRSPVDAMLISDHSPPFDGLRLVYRGGNWSYAFHATMLDAMYIDELGTVRRYLVGHRFNWRPHPNLELALSEVILFGGVDRPWEFNYLNPILPYYWEQLNTDTDDNPLWNIEASWRFHSGWEIYGEWMIDDFQIDFVSEPQQIGVMGGLVWWPPVFDGRLMLNAEYQRINTFVYGQRRPWNRYVHYRDINNEVIGIGSDLGTDADRITFRPRWYLSRNLDLTGLAEYVRRGVNRIDTDQAGPLPGGEDFPSGIVERTLTGGLGVRVQTGGYLVLDVNAGYQRIENVEHALDADREGPYIQLHLTTLWWKTFGG